ncbi:hypothetical protein MOD31_18650 [Paenarthrobacter sp. TYUT067]|uniref:hypothetical protein n=1 Tax=Paenarthrobacter sp. TYUT067 TaxID=2926245 RepID=UPI00203093A0|nr:hypothetical protein [Paenarthrobacter sp. TYUT067]MCM0618048.1 hypothetical protein [Paenarthrobacter sp. TYUT067]
MSGKICSECGERFEPSRASQRFCSTRCANRQRDRRRRQKAAGASSAPAALATPDPRAKASASGARQHNAEARFSSALATSSKLLDSLNAQLRSQAADIDHLAAENADQRAMIKGLRADIDRHQTANKSDAQDLVRLAGKLLALSQATGLELDDTTKAVFRRRGWTSSSRHREAQKQ